MLNPNDRLQIDAVSNGYLVCYERWETEENKWIRIKEEVYSDPLVLLDLVREELGVVDTSYRLGA